MDKRLAKLNLFTKDYSTREKADLEFKGEVILQDEDFKQHIYRFYQQDTGEAISIDINYKDDEIKVEERTPVVLMQLSFEKDKLKKCTYQFLDNGLVLNMLTRLVDVHITSDEVEFVYDIYEAKDPSNPITRNVLTIRNEAKDIIC